jgi:hypothetical protein
MVACARRNIVDRARSGVFHCGNRCVRQACLWGKDAHTKTDCPHRRGWIRQRMEQLAACRRCTSDAAVLICGMYVDLNPIRAGEATTPETSRFTSAFERIESRQQRRRRVRKTADGWMCELTLEEGPREDLEGRYPSRSGRRASDQGLIPVSLDKYLELLDWTGRQFREGKRGAIPAHLAPILQRLKINEELWLDALECLDEWFGPVLGRAADLAKAAARVFK